ncbi:MAG: hypothetical protein HYV28_06245 [Ignavibacteriales bacterium]|nr:hypothetical protein [Ignavibacteriales bacterium]
MLIILSAGCKKNPVDSIDSQQPGLQIVDTGTREVYLLIQSLDGTTPVVIHRGDKEIFNNCIAGTDTLLTDDSLSANTRYQYRAAYQKNGKLLKEVSGETITLNKTQNTFTCYLDTMGYAGYSNDVFIVDENNIWVAGRFSFKDPEHPGTSLRYNAAKWNGSKWEYYAVESSIFNSEGVEVAVSYAELTAVFGLSKNNVWFTDGLQLIHWDGTKFARYAVPKELFSITTIYGLWGTDAKNIYMAGVNGVIIHYDGVTMKRMETGTVYNLGAIRGSGEEIYAVGMTYTVELNGGIVLKKEGDRWVKQIEAINDKKRFIPEEVLKTQLIGNISGLYMNKSGSIYVSGNYLYQCKAGKWSYLQSLPQNHPDSGWIDTRGYITSIDGTGINDLFVCGPGRFVAHYNGEEWKDVYSHYQSGTTPGYGRIRVKGNVAVAVGGDSYRGFVLRIYR